MSSFEQGKEEQIAVAVVVVVVECFEALADRTFEVQVGKGNGFGSFGERVGNSFDFAWEGIEGAFEEVRNDVA